MTERYIVYISYKSWSNKNYVERKEVNSISDIVAIVKSEEKAKAMVEEYKSKGIYMDYKKILWEE